MINKYSIGLVLGIVLSIVVVLTNIVFPNNSSDDGRIIGLSYLILFILFMGVGYFLSKKTNPLKNGAIAGAVSSAIAFFLTMLTFIVIDNLFLGIVSKQAEKIYGFTHQNTYQTMRDFINSGNLRGLVFGIIMATVFGGLAGALGASLRKLRILK